MTLAGFPEAAPMAGLAGGILIGLAAALMLLGAGRIAGVSGMAARAFGLSEGGAPRSLAWAFVLGLPLGAFVVALFSGGIEARFTGFLPIVIAGLLVGFRLFPFIKEAELHLSHRHHHCPRLPSCASGG